MNEWGRLKANSNRVFRLDSTNYYSTDKKSRLFFKIV